MIKRILIPLDPSPYTDAALGFGCFIAKHSNAELTGLAVLDVPGIEKSVGPIPMGGSYYAKKLREKKKYDALERIEQLMEKFKEKCDAQGVACREEEEQGSPAGRIIDIALYYDLVIIGLQTHFNFASSESPGETLHKILGETISPILAVPEYFHKPYPAINVVIAFNESFPSARALQCFVQLPNPDNFKVTIIVSDKEMDTANCYLDQAEAYLQAHGFVNIAKKWTPKGIIHTMEEDYYDGADLIVAGMHSRKGIFDFFVGSLSKYLIERGEKAVLLGQ